MHGRYDSGREASDKHVDDSERAEQEGNDAIEREEGKVDAGEIVGFDEGVLVDEQEDGEGDGDEINGFELGGDQAEGDEEGGGEGVGGAGNPESFFDAEFGGDGEGFGLEIGLIVLAGVDDVEAGGPEEGGGGHDERGEVESSFDGDPGAEEGRDE